MKRMLSVLAIGVLASGFLAAPASAAAVATDPLAATTAAAQEVAAYWLADGGVNLRNATPYDVQTSIIGEVHPTSGTPDDTKPGSIAPLPGAGGKTPTAAGKVFFVTADGQPHWCTGTAVQSQYRNLVATAGHCVHDLARSTTLDRWVFVPGYSDGTMPSGLYVGHRAFTHYDFGVYRDFDRDYAFATVYNGVVATPEGGLSDAGRLGDQVNALGLAWSQSLGGSVDVFGYPAGAHPDGKRPYTGDVLESSRGKTAPVAVPSLAAEELVAVGSPFTGEGALGSSWILRYQDGMGYLSGITISVADTDGDQRYDTSLSPYFDGETAAIYKMAAASWSGRLV
ncbi:trypsin-like serine peptidase [Nonomuraea aridisoli]|uniref:Trypsin-like serine protease n=1 Tax=Nonomuraea aridisoli TaxID=2070368 RepID=A0A2W2FSY4_9ACTN|nr:hypothetical protein [Nonomuraea aridisoli]PZG18154.1 hypothetical protein C1J01_15820 [Nonomuraea aridisoli]